MIAIFGLTLEPEELFVVHKIALSRQKYMNAPATKPPALMGNRLHPLVSNCHAAAADGFTHRPLAHLEDPLKMGDSSALGSGRHHFFPSKFFSTALSAWRQPRDA